MPSVKLAPRDRNAAQRCGAHRQIRTLHEDALRPDSDSDGAGNAAVPDNRAAEKRLQPFKRAAVVAVRDEALRTKNLRARQRLPTGRARELS